MNKKLYNSIVRGISESLQKSLYEGLFDDVDDILSNDDINSSQLMDDYLKKLYQKHYVQLMIIIMLKQMKMTVYL